MPRRAIEAATRDAAVYLNIELIGGSLLKMKSPAQGRARVTNVSGDYEPSLVFFRRRTIQ